MKLTNENQIRLSPEVVFQEVSGEMVLLDLNSEQYFGLDEVGTRVWELLKDEGSYGQLVERMLAEYDVTESELRKDLEALFSGLHKEGLVTVV